MYLRAPSGGTGPVVRWVRLARNRWVDGEYKSVTTRDVVGSR